MLAYNHEKYICQAINSVLAQKTNFNYEILVGDDASTDDTKNLLNSRYQDNDKVRLFLRNKNVGASKNAYTLFMHAKGKYLCACECDDYWTDEHYLQAMADWLDSHKDYAGVAARRVMLSEKTSRQTIKKTVEECNCDISIDDLMNWEKVFECAACLFVNFFHDGKSDYRLYRMARNVGDLAICIHILQHGKVYQLERIIGVYRIDRIKGTLNYNSVTTNQERFLDYINIIKYLKKYCYPELDYSLLEAREAYIYLTAIRRKKEWVKGTWIAIKRISLKASFKLIVIFKRALFSD